MKNSFILYTEIWPAIQKLDMEQRGKLFTAIMKHALGEEPEKLDILTDVIFTFIKSQLDRDEQKYQEVCKRRAEYGRKGGLAKASKSQQKPDKKTKMQQSIANVADNDNENDNDNDNDNENENEAQAPDGLSLLPGTELELRKKYGERSDALIEDVRTYYTAHPEKPFPGWPIAVAQFERNQARWGKASAPRGSLQSMQEILNRVVPEE